MKTTSYISKEENYFSFALFGVILLMVPVVIFARNSLCFDPYSAIKDFSFRLFLVLFILVFTIKSVIAGEIKLYRTTLFFPVAIFLAVGLLSGVMASNLYVFRDEFIRWLLAGLFVFLFAQVKKDEWLVFFAVVTVAAASIVSVIAIYQYVSAESVNLATTVKSTLGHSNFLAQYLVAVIPITLALILSVEKVSYVLLGSAAFITEITALALSFTRGGWIACTGSLFVFGIIIWKYFPEKKIFTQRRLIAAIIVVALVIGYAAVQKPHIVKSIFSFYKTDVSSLNPDEGEIRYKTVTVFVRLEMWKGTWQMIKENPVFGVGLGNYWIMSQKYRTTKEKDIDLDILQWAHNDFLQIGAETGFVGIAAFIFLLFSVFKSGFNLIKHFDRTSKTLSAGLICSVVATILHSMVSFNFFKTAPFMYFCLAAAFLSSKSGKELHFSLPKQVTVKAIISVVLIAFFVFSGYYLSSNLMGEVFFLPAEKASIQKKWGDSIPLLIKALNYAPHNAKLRYALALSYFKTGNFKEAIEQGDFAYKLTPYVADVNRILCYAHNEEGNVYFASKDYASALNEYVKVVELCEERKKIKLRSYEVSSLEKELANAYYNRGNTYNVLGQKEKARDDFTRALYNNSDHYFARQSLKNLSK